MLLTNKNIRKQKVFLFKLSFEINHYITRNLKINHNNLLWIANQKKHPNWMLLEEKIFNAQAH